MSIGILGFSVTKKNIYIYKIRSARTRMCRAKMRARIDLFFFSYGHTHTHNFEGDFILSTLNAYRSHYGRYIQNYSNVICLLKSYTKKKTHIALLNNERGVCSLFALFFFPHYATRASDEIAVQMECYALTPICAQHLVPALRLSLAQTSIN